MLGVRMSALTEEISKVSNYNGNGVHVDDVNPNGTAGKLGITKGCIIQKINGKEIMSQTDLRIAISDLRQNDDISITYFKNGETKTTKGKGISRPKESHPNANVYYDIVAYKDNVLRSILYTPKNVSNPPVVYYLQGYTCQSIEYPNRNPIKHLINNYIEAGFAVYLVEKPGMGDSKSKTHCRDINFHQELEGFKQGYKALLKKDKIDTNNIFMFGHSMGGVVAPVLAQELNPKGVITFGTVGKNWYDYMKDIFTEQQEIFGAPKDEIQENLKYNVPFITDMMIHKKSNIDILNNTTYKQYLTDNNLVESLKQGYYMGRHHKFWASLNDINIPKAWANVSSDVLVMHGEFDIQAINQKYAKVIVDLVNGNKGRGTFALLKNTDHVFLKFDSMQHNVETLNSGAYRQYMRDNYNSEVAKESIKWMQTVIN